MSGHFDGLKEMHKTFYPEYKSWMKENYANFPLEKIGNGVFTTQEASDLLLEFAETIKIVLEDKEQCLKYVSSGELSIISGNFPGILDAAKNEAYSDFANNVEGMIPHMRPFQFLSMEKMDKKRYREISDMDKTLSGIRETQISATSNVKKVLSDSEKVRKLIELTNQQNEELKSLIDDNNQKTNNVAGLHAQTNDYLNQIIGVLNSANEHKAVIDGFVNLIQEREENIISQNAVTKAYETKLANFSAEQQVKLNDFTEKCRSSMEKAESLIKKSHEALNLSTANGLSKAFYTRQEKLENKQVKQAWLIAGGVAVVLAISIGIYTFFDKDITIANVAARTLLMTILIGVAVFCSKQYAKNRILEEDYAYKVALAASMPGIAEECEKAGLRKEYVVKLLDEILQDPQRARHDKESSEDNYFSVAEVQKNMKNVATKTDEAKPN